MSTNQGTAGAASPGPAELADELQSTLASADSLAAARVRSLSLVHQARAARLSREVEALKAEHAPDHEVAAAAVAGAANAFSAARAAATHQQLITAVPEVGPNGWALHGRVYDAGWTPVSGFTVFLVDAQKTYQQAYGFAFTDDTGYFLINYPGPAGPTKPASKSSASKAAARSAPLDSAEIQRLFLEIADASAQPVYLSETAFQPVRGSAVYQNVTLAPGNQPIGDPPKEIRDIAMPPDQPRKSPPPRR